MIFEFTSNKTPFDDFFIIVYQRILSGLVYCHDDPINADTEQAGVRNKMGMEERERPNTHEGNMGKNVCAQPRSKGISLLWLSA